MKSKCLALSAAVSILTVAARGDTLAWFRFEELTGKTGDSLAIGSQFVDSGEGERVLQLQDFGRKQFRPELTALTSKPMKVDEAESERVLYTDGSKTSPLGNDQAVAFKNGEKGDGNNDGSVLRVIETESTRLTPQTFTIEFLYRNTKQFTFASNTCMSFFGRRYKLMVTDGKETGSGAGNCPASFELALNNGNKFQLRYTYLNGSGQAKTTHHDYGVDLGVTAPGDALWHHYAVTVDQATHSCKFYVDGALAKTLTLEGDIYWGNWDATYHDILSWTFGGNYFGWSLSGSMDEIRISDEALEPEDFLTLGSAAQEPVKEGESILYLPFDDAGNTYATKLYSIAQPELNPEADGALEKVVDTWFQNQYVSFGAAGVGEIVQGVDEGITRGANTGCLHFQVPSGAVTSDFGYTPTAFKFKDYGYSKLTIECFFRYDAPAYAVRSGWPELLRFIKADGSRALTCQFTDASRLRISIGASAVVTTPFRFDDSRWHHLALTIDTTKKVFEYYVDYNIISSGSYTGTFALDENWKLSIGPRSKINGFIADVDEFRISHGILSRDKMLATRKVPAFPAAVPVAASTKAWYRFEETDLGSGALPVGTVFYNRGNPSILPAEVIAVPRTVDDSGSRGQGAFYGPTSVAVADGGYIDEGVLAGGPNHRALKFSDSADGAKSGSMLRIGASSTHSLCLQTFTVEFFYQTGGGNNEKFDAKNWTTFFANHNTAGGDAANSTFELRHCGDDEGTTTGNFTVLYRSAANGDKTQVKVTGENWQIPTDGQRHHYAITLDQATHACELFVDHESRGAITLAGDLKYADNFDTGNGSDQHWYVGGNYYGFTRSGTLDEFRFSDKVLTPEEMLRPGVGPVDEGETIAYLPLDSDLSSFVGSNPYTNDATLAANAAKFVSGDAGFAEDVKAFRVLNAPKGRGHNSASLALDGRSGHDCQIFYPLYAQNLARFGYKKLTCEFFFKGSCEGAWENIVGLRSAKSAAKWAFLLQHGAGSTVTFRTDTDKVTSTVPATVPNADIFDGKWHHIAVTIDGETVPGKTRFTCFFDYQQVGSVKDVDGSATGSFFTETACIDFGTPKTQAGLKGQVDELKLSAGLLEPEDFIRMQSGFQLILR